MSQILGIHLAYLSYYPARYLSEIIYKLKYKKNEEHFFKQIQEENTALSNREFYYIIKLVLTKVVFMTYEEL